MALTVPGPLRRPYIVADAVPVTVGDMVAAVRRGLGRRPGLIPVPASLVARALTAMGHADWNERLSGSLVADASALTRLGWTPRVATPAGLAALVSVDR
jgi:UDP-glucose 4-epimerase